MARISTDTMICGILARDLRTLARECVNTGFSPEALRTHLDMSESAAKKAFKALIAEGYLQEHEEQPGRIVETLALGSIRVAKLLKPISRGRLEALMDAVIARVEENNADPERMCDVMSVDVFGSYWRKQADYGDLDLILNMQTNREWLQRNERMVWALNPHRDTARRIKARQPHLSFSDHEMFVPPDADLRRVWTIKAGRVARPSKVKR